MSRLLAVFLCALAFAVTGCASTKVNRIDATAVTDLSGMWNDTDARLVAEEMIKECLQGQWVWDFNKATGRTPTVIVGTIRNKTMEHIDPGVFISSLQKTLIDSGKVNFVASKDERNEIREERAEQVGNAEPTTISTPGHETGADFMLQGSINSIEEGVENHSMMFSKEKSTSFYQVNLELVDMHTNQKRWIGQKAIKKLTQRSKVF